MTRAFGDIEYKDLIIAEPETCTQAITADDDLLILASDGIYKSYSREYVAQRASALRKTGMPLGQIAETIVKEALCSDKKPRDNVTILIISLSDYLSDYERTAIQSGKIEVLAIRKQSSYGDYSHYQVEKSSQKVFDQQSHHSVCALSNDGRTSGASLNNCYSSSPVGSANPFFNGSSNPSS